MKYYVYDLHPRFCGGYVYKGKEPPKLVMTLDTGDEDYLTFMKNHWYEDYCYKIADESGLELDNTYYIVDEECKNFYVLSLHKGWTFWDGAEHDERVIIAVELGLSKEQACIV